MDEKEFNIELSRAASVAYFDKTEGRRLYYNAEMEHNFPDDEMIMVNGRELPKRIYERDEEFRKRIEQYHLDVSDGSNKWRSE